jgi:hypothetical protein
MNNPPPITDVAMAKFLTILRMKCLRGGIGITSSELAAMPTALLVNAILLLVSRQLVFDGRACAGARPCVILTPSVVALNSI